MGSVSIVNPLFLFPGHRARNVCWTAANRLCEAIGGVPTLGEINLWGMRARRAASISKPKRSILYRAPTLRQGFLDTPVLQPGMACP